MLFAVCVPLLFREAEDGPVPLNTNAQYFYFDGKANELESVLYKITFDFFFFFSKIYLSFISDLMVVMSNINLLD